MTDDEARIDELERIRKKFLWQLSNKSLQRAYQIALEELDKYTQDRIKELKENKQYPFIDLPNMECDNNGNYIYIKENKQ